MGPIELTSIPEKRNVIPFVDPQTQLSAGEVNEIVATVNENALFYGVFPTLELLRRTYPSPKIGARAFLQNKEEYKSITGVWERIVSTTETDHKIRLQFIHTAGAAGNVNELSVIADKINELTAFEIQSDEQYIFYTYQGSEEKGLFRVNYLLTSGKGNYGNGGVAVRSRDLVKQSYYYIALEEINGIVAIDTADGQSIAAAINNSGPYGIQGDRFFSTTISGVTKLYLYIGGAGVIGDGNTQTTVSDFLDVYESSSDALLINITSVSGFATIEYVDQAEQNAKTYTDNRIIGLATQEDVDQAEQDANTYTDLNVATLQTLIDNIIAILDSDDLTLDELQEIVDYIKQNREDLENLNWQNIAGLPEQLTSIRDLIAALNFNLFKGNWNASTNVPLLSDEGGVTRWEYRVIEADATGTSFDFGSGPLLLKNDDIIIYNGSRWIKKIDNNQTPETLLSIPQSSRSPVAASALNIRMLDIFNQSGFVFNTSVEGVNSVSSLTGATFAVYAVNTERYLLVNFSSLDDEIVSLLSSRNKVFNMATSRSGNLANNDIIGESRNQFRFITNPVSNITGVPPQYTVFRISSIRRTSFASIESMLVSLNLIGDLNQEGGLNQLITQTYEFTDQDFISDAPIELLPAPGENRLYEVISFSGSQDITQIYLDNGVFTLLQGYLFAVGDLQINQIGKYYKKFSSGNFVGGDGALGIYDIINKPLQLGITRDSTGGKGTIKFNLTYLMRSL